MRIFAGIKAFIMNIIYVLNGTSLTGGATKAFLTIVNGMLSKHNTIYAILPNRHGVYHELCRMGVEVIVVPLRPLTYPFLTNLLQCVIFIPMLLSWWIRNAYSLYKLKRIFKNKHIDLIHTNVSIIGIGYSLAKYLEVPHIYHIREYADLDFHYHYFPTKKSFYRRLQTKNSYNICITKAIQAYHGLTSSGSSRVIYDGISLQEAKPDKDGRHDYFLYAGRIEISKGAHDLIKAYFQYTKRTNTNIVPLKLAGGVADSVYETKLKRLIEKYHIQEHVQFLGERKDIGNLMRNAKAIILPSLHEGFGLCMPEAMCNHCVVIARNTAGFQEQFANGIEVTGEAIGLPFSTNEELTQHLLDVASRPFHDYDTIRERAKHTVEHLYSPEIYVRNIQNFYDEIILKSNDEC